MMVSEWIEQHPSLPMCVPPDYSMEQTVATFLENAASRDLYVVSTEGLLLGILRHQRLARMILAEHLPVHSSALIMERLAGGTAQELMERDFVFARPDEALDNVLHRLLEYEVEHLPVLSANKKLLGSICLSDVLRKIHKIN